MDDLFQLYYNIFKSACGSLVIQREEILFFHIFNLLIDMKHDDGSVDGSPLMEQYKIEGQDNLGNFLNVTY